MPLKTFPPKVGTRTTQRAFRLRFNFEERAAIESAAETNPGVRVFLKDLESGPTVDLSDQLVSDGLTHLVGQDLITQERADEIRQAPVQQSELP